MRFFFKDKKLENLYLTGESDGEYDLAVTRAFFKVMQWVKWAKDERDLRERKSLHYEKLEEKRFEGMYSLRLKLGIPLIIDWCSDDEGKYVLVVEIDKTHYKKH
jgi:proteic killer suppression protein